MDFASAVRTGSGVSSSSASCPGAALVPGDLQFRVARVGVLALRSEDCACTSHLRNLLLSHFLLHWNALCYCVKSVAVQVVQETVAVPSFRDGSLTAVPIFGASCREKSCLCGPVVEYIGKSTFTLLCFGFSIASFFDQLFKRSFYLISSLVLISFRQLVSRGERQGGLSWKLR